MLFEQLFDNNNIIRQAIENKIASEVQPLQEELKVKDAKIATLEEDNAKINYALMMGGLI